MDASFERSVSLLLAGLGVRGLPRDEAFCAHAILQYGDEPTVVLDTKKDWRFRRHVCSLLTVLNTPWK